MINLKSSLFVAVAGKFDSLYILCNSFQDHVIVEVLSLTGVKIITPSTNLVTETEVRSIDIFYHLL